MNLAKKILLSLMFSLTFTEVILYLIFGIINTNYYLDPNTDPEIIVNQLEVIMDWVFFGLFLLASISSFFWLMNFGSNFQWLKIPALLILPLSVPFLIIDAMEKKNTQNKEKIEQQNSMVNAKKNETASLIVLSIAAAVNILTAILQTSLIVPIAIHFQGWYYLLTGIPLALLLGTLFLMLSYYNPNNKVLFWLSFLGFTFNWISLFLKLIDQKQSNYFFKPTNAKIPVIPAIPATY